MPVEWEQAPSWEETFVANMVRERQGREMSQTELARRIRKEGVPCHQQTVQRIEQRTRSPRLNEAQAIANVLFFGRWETAIAAVDASLLHQLLREGVERLEAHTQDSGRRLADLLGEGSNRALDMLLDRDRYVQAAAVEGAAVDSELLAAADRAVADWQSFEERSERRGEHSEEA